jgi:hypothetical protein
MSEVLHRGIRAMYFCSYLSSPPAWAFPARLWIPLDGKAADQDMSADQAAIAERRS